MALIKRNGQLFEEKDDSLMSRVNQLGANTPTSPFGAAGIGVNADSAKMVGSGAQRKNALKQAVAPKEQTLAGQQRLQNTATATQADIDVQQKAQQIRQLGSMGTRVQSIMEQQLANAGTKADAAGGATITADEIGIQNALGYTPEQLAADKIVGGPNVVGQLKELIDDYMVTPSEDLLKQMVALGLTEDQVYTMTGLTETGQQATARTIQDAMAKKFTISDLDVTQLGFDSIEELSKAMGTDVSTMTVPEFQKAVENLQQAEFDRIDEIKAQLSGLPPNSARAQQLQAELRALSDVGRTGAEATVEEAARAIDTAESVKIGDKSFTVEELLSDGGVSEIIEDYLMADPEDRDGILPPEQFSGLISWINNNQAALNGLIQGAKDTRESFQQANARWEDMQSNLGISEDLLRTMGWNPDDTVTSESLNEWIQNNGFGQELGTGIGSLYTLNEDGNLTLKDNISQTTVTDINPDNQSIISNMTAAEIEESHAWHEQVENQPVLADLMGITDISNNFLTAEQVAQAKQWEPIAKALSSTTMADAWSKNTALQDAVKQGKIGVEWLDPKYSYALTDPLSVELITSGQLTIDNISMLERSNWDSAVTEYKNNKAKHADLQRLFDNNDVDGMLRYLTHDDSLNVDEYRDWLRQAEFQAKFGNEKAITARERLKELLDKDKLMARVQSGQSLMDFLNHTATPPKSVIKPSIFSLDERYRGLYEAAGDDGLLSFDELMKNTAAIDRAQGLPIVKANIVSQDTYDAYVKARTSSELRKKIGNKSTELVNDMVRNVNYHMDLNNPMSKDQYNNIVAQMEGLIADSVTYPQHMKVAFREQLDTFKQKYKEHKSYVDQAHQAMDEYREFQTYQNLLNSPNLTLPAIAVRDNLKKKFGTKSIKQVMSKYKIPEAYKQAAVNKSGYTNMWSY